MRDAMKIALKKRGFTCYEFDETSIRIDNRKYARTGGPESLRGCIVPPACERPSDIIKKYKEAVSSCLTPEEMEKALELIRKNFYSP